MDQPGVIPDHWKWVKLGEISTYGDTPQKVKPGEIGDQAWILELEDIENGGRILARHYGNERKPKGEKTVFHSGQVLYSKLRPYLRKVLVADDDGVCTPEIIAFDVCEGVNAAYLSYCLINSYTDRVIGKRSYGIKMPRVDAAFMANLSIPLPPTEEQDRIVELVAAVSSEIDCLEVAQQVYTKDVQSLRSRILDAGISGHLTEQRPEDGNAEQLYEEICRAKKVLQSRGILRRSKTLPKIETDELPFDIPDNWKWVRFGDLYKLTNGVASRGSQGGTLRPVLRLADLVDETIDCSDIRAIALTEPEYNSHIIHPGDLVFIRVNGSRGKVGNAYFYEGNKEISYCDHLFCGSSMSESIVPEYIRYVFQTSMAKAQIDPFIKTTAGQNTISQVNLGRTLVPLPPTAEQKRIVKRIDELLSALPK